MVAPTSTIDMDMASGDCITIEQRSAEELLVLGGRSIGIAGAGTWNPAFDITPACLVDALVTERGVVLTPNREKIARLMTDSC